MRRERELQTERSAHRPDTVLDHAFHADRLIARLKILRSDEISQAIPRLACVAPISELDLAVVGNRAPLAEMAKTVGYG